MTQWAYAQDGRVWIRSGHDDEDLDPDEAREMAAQLTRHAEEADGQLAAIQAACADGHDWGDWHNQHYTDGIRRAKRYCQRRGCRTNERANGWAPFVAMPHPPMTVECIGLGCDVCDQVRLGQQLNKLLGDVMTMMEKTLFNPPDAPSQPDLTA